MVVYKMKWMLTWFQKDCINRKMKSISCKDQLKKNLYCKQKSFATFFKWKFRMISDKENVWEFSWQSR